MTELADPSISSWVQTGGVLAFAGAVLLQLRELRPLIDSLRTTVAALLERERARDERRAVQSWDDDITEPLGRVPRPRTSPYGFPAVSGGYAVHNKKPRGGSEG